MQPIHLCIGAARAGTSWLYHNLDVQPSIYTPVVKEVRYWAGRRSAATLESERAAALRAAEGRADHRQQLDWLDRWSRIDVSRPEIGEYRSLMAMSDRPSIDISPIYSLLSEARVRALAAGLPEGSKVVYLVRDPLARMLSHLKLRFYMQGSYRGIPEEASLDRFFSDPRQLRRNDYAQVIKLWQSVFGGRFAYFAYDDLLADPSAMLRRIGDHLGLQIDLRMATETANRYYWTDKDDSWPRPPDPGPDLRRRAAQAVLPFFEDFADLRPEIAQRWRAGLEAALEGREASSEKLSLEPELEKLMRMTESLGGPEFPDWCMHHGYEAPGLFGRADRLSPSELAALVNQGPVVTGDAGEQVRSFWARLRHKPGLYVIAPQDDADEASVRSLLAALRRWHAAHQLLWVHAGAQHRMYKPASGLRVVSRPSAADAEGVDAKWTEIMREVVDDSEVRGLLDRMTDPLMPRGRPWVFAR